MISSTECTSVATLSSNIPYAKSEPPRPLKQCISIGSDFSEDQFDQNCCFGQLNVMSWLQIVTLWNLVLDALCTFLSLEHIATYLFAVSTTVSLLCLCSVINGVQEEKRAMIKFPALWAGVKLVVLCALSLTAVAGLTEEHLTHVDFELSLELKLLFCLLPIAAVLLFVQYHLSSRVMELIKLRDELYVIPSSPASKSGGANGLGSGALSRMRNSLRLHLENQMRKNHVPTSPIDMQKY
uniref:Transmembrane protein n=1 Tax=Ditylenchus dipsaci TaxID=166011 RepID=A0A915D248_9BILA